MFNWVLISLVASLTKVNHAGGQNPQSYRPTDTSYPRYKRISPAFDPYETRKCVPIPEVSISEFLKHSKKAVNRQLEINNRL